MPADIAIWPISFQVASNQLENLYEQIQNNNQIIVAYLKTYGISSSDISIPAPIVTDLLAQNYGHNVATENQKNVTNLLHAANIN